MFAWHTVKYVCGQVRNHQWKQFICSQQIHFTFSLSSQNDSYYQGFVLSVWFNSGRLKVQCDHLDEIFKSKEHKTNSIMSGFPKTVPTIESKVQSQYEKAVIIITSKLAELHISQDIRFCISPSVHLSLLSLYSCLFLFLTT